MKVGISLENGHFVVSDEFGLIREEFDTQEKAFDFVFKKFQDSLIIRAILYIRKEET